MARSNQRSAANAVGNLKSFRQRQKLGIAPHVKVTTREGVFRRDGFQCFVIVGNLQRGKTLFAKRTGRVAPQFAALAATQLINLRHRQSNRGPENIAELAKRATAK